MNKVDASYGILYREAMQFFYNIIASFYLLKKFRN